MFKSDIKYHVSRFLMLQKGNISLSKNYFVGVIDTYKSVDNLFKYVCPVMKRNPAYKILDTDENSPLFKIS